MRATLLILCILLSTIANGAENNDTFIKVSEAFDSGVLPLYKIEKDKVVFDITTPSDKGTFHLHCLLQSNAPSVLLEFTVNEKRIRFYGDQGLYISADGNQYKPIPYTKVNDSTFQVKADLVNGQLFVATDLPYGRNMLDKLIVETLEKGNWKIRSKDNRPVMLFELGNDDGKKPIHYLWAEDAYETGGAWVVDNMIRALYENPELAKKLTDNAVIRICPTISAYSLNAKSCSYTGLDGKSCYGAAGWNKMPPYPELAIMTEMLEKTISEKRLGFVMTFHCSYSAIHDSEVETIKSAGENTLSQERADWAMATMNTIMDGVRRKKVKLPDKCWYEGLLREHFLSKYNAITFRIEISTYDQENNGYRAMAETMLNNLAKIGDWAPVWDANWKPALN